MLGDPSLGKAVWYNARSGLRGKPHVKRKCYMLTSHHDVNALSNLFIIVKKIIIIIKMKSQLLLCYLHSL